jgi:hypothetical protein
MTLRPPPPSGHQPPETAHLGGRAVRLVPLAEEICRRYRAEFPDEAGRYGEAGQAWCVHDNRHILNWAVEALEYGADLDANLRWLRTVLQSREFPVERLVRDLEIAADVVAELLPGAAGLAERLRAGAVLVAGAEG